LNVRQSRFHVVHSSAADVVKGTQHANHPDFRLAAQFQRYTSIGGRV
jgi:hypothetical protein